MSPGRRKFHRLAGVRPYRKLFVIAVEGIKTEPQYFALYNSQQSVIRVNCLKGGYASSPPQVLKRMEKHLAIEKLRSSDEAWLVVDKDQWTDTQLAQLHNWALKRTNYGFALSNPKFEYWLLLHFEDGTAVSTSRDCSERLKRYLPDYDKGISADKFTTERISAAIARARRKDNPPCPDWPQLPGGTTVYRLVERILSGKK
ncbi:MAG: abortive phage resistance protein [Candidatus Wallbacteria bacterium HGW-Wallbacteria-1]|jgi:hypothetical protein|uniref:Abortive phage resistance protein n=1 Tax=Candidatus Wallbacteria bacterium HGW-Wallbacteria-1 TaxID=2013854 RepID=A0A2N1PJE9_9BACT|nr:MAG: abortive phage resistance protein [Candidatus Wallbacteria bacterium HGW-Wallbacteria-1]